MTNTPQRKAIDRTTSTPTVVESYPAGQLPAPGTAGRLARVTDRHAPLWMDNGSRWGPLVENTVNALGFCPISTDPTNDAAAATADTIQAALNSGANVYLPAGTYRIDKTLYFHSGQTIFGDGKGSTILTSSEPIAMFQSAVYPSYTRDVLIRDIRIDNDDTKAYANPGAIGIDFTGVSFSRIERVSMRWHEIGIRGRDSALRTWVRANSTATMLHVTATDTLYTGGENITIAYKSADGTDVRLTGKVNSVASHTDPDYPALGVTLAAGSPPLPSIPVGAMVYQTFQSSAGGGGYYNSVVDCEITSCTSGVALTNSGNNWTVLDGRFFENVRGVYVEASVGNRFRSAWEKNGVGVEFGGGGDVNTVLGGAYFENNGNLKEVWAPLHVTPPVLAAVYCHLGAVDNTIEPGLFSDGTDTVVDENNGRNTSLGAFVQSFPSMASGHSNGHNVLCNGDFAVTSQVTGIADGWNRSTNAPVSSVFDVVGQSAAVPPGARTALSWGMRKGRNDLFYLYRQVDVVPGQWYTFTGYSKVNANGDGLYRILIVPRLNYTQPEELYYSAPMPAHDYSTGFHRGSFQVPSDTTSVYLILANVNNDPSKLHNDPSCWTPDNDDVAATAWFGKFQLEPGRGIPSESHAGGLMAHVQTSGGQLVATAALPVTHSFHTVAPPSPQPSTGPVAIQNIMAPQGFSGLLVLHATGDWTTRTDGVGPGKIGTKLTMSAGSTTFGWYDTTSRTWWFSPAS